MARPRRRPSAQHRGCSSYLWQSRGAPSSHRLDTRRAAAPGYASYSRARGAGSILSFGHLRADRRLRILAEIRVPERVVADLVAVAHQVLELLAFVGRLVEEMVGRVRAGEHVERRAVAELRMLAGERFEDADGRLRIDLDVTVLLEVAELTGRGIVEGENDRSGPGWQREAPVEQISQIDQPVGLRIERLEVATKVLGRPRPSRLGV